MFDSKDEMALYSPEELLHSIDKRLRIVEEMLQITQLQQTIAKPDKPLAQQSVSLPMQPQSPVLDAPAIQTKTKSGNWLGIIAIICFVLAAGFIVKLSIDSGWLTPARQMGLAALFGYGLIISGFLMFQSDREYASLLPASGIIILYITVFAAHLYHKLIPFEIAISLSSIVSGLCIWLYTRIRHDIYPISAAIGAYVSPIIMGLYTGNAEFAVYYFMFCSVAFSAISIWAESRILTVISAYLAILMTAFIGGGLQQDLLIASALAINFIVFAVGTYLYSRKNRQPLTEKEAYSFLPVMLVFYAAEYYFINRLGSQSIIMMFTTIVCFHSIYLELLPAIFHPWLFVLIMLGVAFLPISLSGRPTGNIFIIPILAISAIMAIEYVTIIYHLWNKSDTSWLVVSWAAFASIWSILIVRNDESNSYGHVMLGAAHILAILGLYRLVGDYGSLAVSASWLFYAVCIIFFAFIRKDEVMAKSALFVLGFSAGKALLYDTSSAESIVRIMCLLLTGGVLYGCGFMLRKISYWKVKL